MKIDAELVSELRINQTWSQDELATATGLNLRTIQRIENEGSASLQSVKAIAAALKVDMEQLKLSREKSLMKFEYKTIKLPFKFGVFKQGLPDIQEELCKAGLSGWQLKQIIMPSTEWGKSDLIIAILERPLA